MNTTLTLDNSPLPHPAMDFTAMRTEAILQLQALSGDVWTDFNQHDPGLTILDQLLYAMTDLSYRLDYDIEDLMARQDGQDQAGMFSPRTILPSRPLTLNDYRKMIIDVPGVRNAWVEVVGFPVPKVFHYPDHTYRIEEGDKGERIILQGLYRAWIELIPGHPGQRSDVVAAVRNRLMAHRNLCEDFMDVHILEPQPVRVVMSIEVGHVEDLPALAEEIFRRLSAFISPELPQHTLQEMLAKGYRTDEIFEGPRLDHGFIDDTDLANYQRRVELRSSDLIQVLMNIPGVTVVRDINLKTGSKIEKWLLPLDSNKAAQLDPLTSTVTFYKEDLFGGTYRPSENVQPGDLRDIPAPWEQDISQPVRKPRHIATYHSLQHHFPASYGLGHNRLFSDVTPQRLAQQKQLQAYLLLFEQILANFFSQAAEAASLYSFTDATPQTYFSQSLLDRIPGIEAVLNPEIPMPGFRLVEGDSWCYNPGPYRPDAGTTIRISGPFGQIERAQVEMSDDQLVKVRISEGDIVPAGPHMWAYTPDHLAQHLQSISEQTSVALNRKNKFLNHVMARFSEQMTEYALLLNQLEPGIHRAASKAIVDKLNFLQEYPLISTDRGGAIDYLRPYDTPDNMPGFVRRILRMLGIAAPSIASLTAEPMEWLQANFELAADADWNEVFAAAGDPGSFTYMEEEMRLNLKRKSGNRAVIAHTRATCGASEQLQAIAEIMRQHGHISERSEGLHIVEHVLLRPRSTDEASGLYVLHQEKRILSFEAHPTKGGGFICHCPAHGLTSYSDVLLQIQGEADQHLKPFDITADTFAIVPVAPLRSDGPPNLIVPIYSPEDPYSLQMTVMLPDWPRRNRDENFRKLVEKTIRLEAPAHIKVYLQWQDITHMQSFEHCYFTWLSHLKLV
jgi:hypothetical protein